MVSVVRDYTLTMADDPKPVLAADGIQELPLTYARAQLTTLIEDARERDTFTAITVRGRRRICLVTPEFLDKALAALGQ